MELRIRPYTMEDWEGLWRLQKAAFPLPFPEEQLWNQRQIQSHIDVFPQGALAAFIDGKVVGSCTSLIIQYDGTPHTWYEVSDHGYIRSSHNPGGDSLYGIDLCVHPDYRGHGVATALYEERKRLVCEFGLKRFIAACRIPDYQKVSDQMDAESYVAAVRQGDLYDTVLSFMFKQGLSLLQVLDDYIEDEESLNKGVLVEWGR